MHSRFTQVRTHRSLPRPIRPGPLALLCGLWLAVSTSGCERQASQRQFEQAFAARNQIELQKELLPRSPVVATLARGEQVEIINRRRRFVQVRTASGSEGWTQDSKLITPQVRDYMERLIEQTSSMASQGVVRALDTLNVHLEPYRWSQTIYQLQEDEPVELLRHRVVDRFPDPPSPGKPAPQPIGVDDWYLVRLSDGQPGWVLAGSVYSAIPDEVLQYAERRRITSYFELGPPREGPDGKPRPTWLWTQIERPKQSYDFDRFRVFMWSRRRQGYETIKLERGLIGYLPVVVSDRVRTDGGSYPGFTITIEKDNRRIERTYALINQKVQFVGERPTVAVSGHVADRPPQPPAPPNPSLWQRLFRW